MPSPHEFVLTLSCRDAKGIVYAVSGLLYEAGCNILDSQQYGDVTSADATGLFFVAAVDDRIAVARRTRQDPWLEETSR